MLLRIVVNVEILYNHATPATSWPATLPDSFLINGSSITPKIRAVRTDMESGPAYQRMTSTARIDTFVASILIDKSKYTDWTTFYETTLAGGSMPFNHTHPLDGSTVVMRFDVTKPPTVAIAG